MTIEFKITEGPDDTSRQSTLANLAMIPVAIAGSFGGVDVASTGTVASRITTVDISRKQSGSVPMFTFSGEVKMGSAVSIPDPDGIGPDLLIPEAQYENCVETAEILADDVFSARLKTSIDQLESGELLDWEDVKASLGL